MKLFYDFLPIIIFFVIFKLYGVYAATIAAIALSLLQVVSLWITYRKIDKMQLVSLILIVVLGGLTLVSHNPRFIQWKLTLVNWLFGLVFLGSHVIGKRTIMERMLAHKINLKKAIFVRLNLMWSLYFIAIGLINLYVMYAFTLNAWVNFKLFGILGLTILFIVLQTLYLARHLKSSHGE